MKFNTNSNTYIIIYSVVMVVIVAVLLSVAALGLAPRQQENMLNEKKTQIVKALGEIDVKLKNTQTALKEVNKAFELDPENMDVAISKMKTLQQAIDETKQKLALEEEAAKKASEALISGKISEADYATILSGITLCSVATSFFTPTIFITSVPAPLI